MLKPEKVVEKSELAAKDTPQKPPPPRKTEAELKFEESRKKRQKANIETTALKTHRERVVEYNKYLESLSEHNDIPRVGPG